MSANESNRLGDVRRSDHPISYDTPLDQNLLAAVDPIKPIGADSPPDLPIQRRLHPGDSLSGAKPPLKTQMPPLRGKYHQNAIPRASVTDVAPPWQASTAIRASIAGAPVPAHDGRNTPSFDEADNTFGSDPREVARNVIVIIDERALVRDCLMHCLQAAYVDHDVFAFSALSDWVKAEDDYPVPSVILLCIRGHRKTTIEDSEDADGFARLATSAPLVIISDIEDASRIMRAIENGARGYIPTSMTLGIAVEAVRLVEAGGTFVPINCVMPSSQNQGNGGSQLFTARQIMVVEALCRGKANKQIAFELGMCESTVKVHIRHIMRKLKARNRTEVAMMVSNLFDKFDQKSLPDT